MAVKSLAQSSLVEPFSTNSMLAGYSGNAFHHLETVRLSSDAASISFSNLERYNDFQHLQLRVVGRVQWSSSQDAGNYEIRLNEATGTYSHHLLRARGSDVISGIEGGSYWNRIPYNNNIVAEQGAFVLDILDFNDSTKNTTMRALGGAATPNGYWIGLESGAWFSTAPVTSIQVLGRGYNIGRGSRFSLYGIKASA